MTDLNNKPRDGEHGSGAPRCYALCGVLLGTLTEQMKSQRPDSTVMLSFWRDEAYFTWRELVGDRMLEWSHRTTFEVVSLRNERGGGLAEDMLVAWGNSLEKQLKT